MRKFLESTSRSDTRSYIEPVVSVQSGLSVTPSQMNQMTRHGIPVSASVLPSEAFAPGVEVGSPLELSLFERRGVDFSDVAVYQQNSRSKVKSYVDSINNSPKEN